MSKLIDTIELPNKLRDLDLEQLQTVVNELRDELINSVARSGGHFASSLGVTELTVALHTVFNTPNDRVIWDVGHQGYIHKMLTGRRTSLGKIRQKGGISGFLKRSESAFDPFGAGHAGTSISAAVGMAQALRETDPERSVIAVIGDGSLTCGMALEALNHAGDLGLGNLIVVLNDNEMSIAPNVGALSRCFSLTVTSKISTRARAEFKKLYKKGYIPEIVYKAIDRAEEATQSWFSGASTLFESFGFRYIGPVDGHNLESLLKALENSRTQDVPVVVHVSTIKGKGFEPAEADPWKWHATTPFTLGETENSLKKEDKQNNSVKTIKTPAPSYTQTFSEALIELAEQNPKIRAITAAMPDGTGLDKFQKAHPDKFFDVGICEQHAVTFAAGLSCEGLIPVCAIYSTFLQRAFDQVVHDVCIQNLPVIFAMDRSGLVGNDGETHQGLFDIAYLRSLPNMTLMAPKDQNELRKMLYTAIELKVPVAIRFPRGSGKDLSSDSSFEVLEVAKAEILSEGQDVLLIGIGNTVSTAVEAANILKEHGLSTTVLNARFIKPLDEQTICDLAGRHSLVCTLEEHSLIGGFGSAVLETLNTNNVRLQNSLKRFGIADHFVSHATQDEQRIEHSLDVKSVSNFVLDQFNVMKKAAEV